MAHAQVDAVPMILRDQAAGVVTLTLNRGERFNPLSSAMIAALAAELDAIAGDATAPDARRRRVLFMDASLERYSNPGRRLSWPSAHGQPVEP